MFPPLKNDRPRTLVRPTRQVLVFILIAAIQLGCGRVLMKAYDEGLVLYGASRVAAGDLPYRDFWTLYGPGSFYVLAALDHLLGPSVLTGRILDAAIRAAVIMLVYRLVGRRNGRSVPLVSALACFLVLAVGVREYLFPALAATATALLALCLMRPIIVDRGGSPWRWLLPGAAVGATALFRPDFGLFASAACLWAGFAPMGGRARSAAALSPFVLGVAAIAVPLYVWLLVRVPGSAVLDDLVLTPARVYVANRSLPFPSPVAAIRAAWGTRSVHPFFGLWPFLSLLVAAGAIVLAAVRRAGGRPSSDPSASGRLQFEATTLLLVCFCAKGAVRVDSVQVLPAALVAIATFGLAFASADVGPAWMRRLPWCAGSIAGLTMFASLVHAHRLSLISDGAPAYVFQALGCHPSAGPRLGCFALDPDRSAVLDYLLRHARAGDRLYVGTGRHDKLVLNNVELYFLSGLPAATVWEELHPGVQTTAVVQQAMMAEMTRRPPAFVVRNTEWDSLEEPNASRYPSGVLLLDKFLQARYRPVLQAGSLSVSVPHAGPSP